MNSTNDTTNMPNISSMNDKSEKSFATHQKIWEKNARQNAKWAVISDPEKVRQEWNQDEFFASGDNDIRHIFDHLNRLKIAPNLKIDQSANFSALDFGCGVGRLTRALSKRFKEVVGVDVSEPMILQARDMNSDRENCSFMVNARPGLDQLSGRSFSMILSLLVIQHIPMPFSAEYFENLVRLLAPDGVMVVQVPSHRTETWRNKVRAAIPEKIFRLKHALLKSEVPYITMFGMRRERVVEMATKNGAVVVDAVADGLAGEDWFSFTYYIRKLGQNSAL